MKTVRNAILLLWGVLICYPVGMKAQDKFDASVGMDLVSGYIWRGQDLGNVSIQPEVSLAYKGFSLTGWGTVGFDKDDIKEFDLTLGYEVKGFSCSVTDYWTNGGPGYFHYGAHNTSHTFEAQIGYDFGFLSVDWFTNFAGNIGYKADGIIPRNEYFSEKGLEPADEYKVGDKIKADVLKLNDGQGNVLMSCKHAKIKEIRKEFKEKVDNKEVFEEEVKQTNKNGLVVLYKNLIRVFIPISLSEVGRDEDVSSYKGKTIRFRVIENDERAKKIIGSVKDLVEEEKKAKEEEFWNNIEVGKKYTGTVTAISDYGAFVDIGGAQGLLHISEMTWGRNQNPRDILEVGQSIEVSVKELDKENKRFKLSYEKKGPNPWNKVEEKYHVGDVVKVKISKIMPFGAFAELEKGIEGLIHISQICERKIAKPEEELQVGQKVNAKIINIDFENKKIELSIRELEGTSQEYKENA